MIILFICLCIILVINIFMKKFITNLLNTFIYKVNVIRFCRIVKYSTLFLLLIYNIKNLLVLYKSVDIKTFTNIVVFIIVNLFLITLYNAYNSLLIMYPLNKRANGLQEQIYDLKIKQIEITNKNLEEDKESGELK